MEYRIRGYSGPKRRENLQRRDDDGKVAVFYHEDGGDQDFNDLIVTVGRLSSTRFNSVADLRGSNPKWQAMKVKEGWAAKLPAHAKKKTAKKR